MLFCHDSSEMNFKLIIHSFKPHRFVKEWYAFLIMEEMNKSGQTFQTTEVVFRRIPIHGYCMSRCFLQPQISRILMNELNYWFMLTEIILVHVDDI